MKIVSIDDIEKRITESFPNQPFKIIEYTRVSKPFAIQCLRCQHISTYSSFNNYIHMKRVGVCGCYNEKSNLFKHTNSIQQIKAIFTNNKAIQFVEYWYKKETQKNMVRAKCLKCNQIYSKPFTEFLKNCNCPFCVGRELLNTQAVKSLLPSEYELLDEYKSNQIPVRIKHSCGFIWKTKVNKLYNYIGCPNCNKKRSKGEQQITAWLIEQGYDFDTEHSFDWQSNLRRRYDFYVPKYNLIIEYMGEQHYLENKLFKTPLLEQQKIDLEKQTEAIQNGYNYLIIGYYDYKDIDTILSNWFNDYPVREQA